MLQVAIQALFSQPTNWYSATRISYVLIHSFNQSFAHFFKQCMNDRRIGSMPIVQAIFYYQSNKQQCTSIMIVNEHQNRCVIMRIRICVHKQCLVEI